MRAVRTEPPCGWCGRLLPPSHRGWVCLPLLPFLPPGPAARVPWLCCSSALTLRVTVSAWRIGLSLVPSCPSLSPAISLALWPALPDVSTASFLLASSEAGATVAGRCWTKCDPWTGRWLLRGSPGAQSGLDLLLRRQEPWPGSATAPPAPPGPPRSQVQGGGSEGWQGMGKKPPSPQLYE